MQPVGFVFNQKKHVKLAIKPIYNGISLIFASCKPWFIASHTPRNQQEEPRSIG